MSMKNNFQNIIARIKKIEQRNQRVELDKAWEGSATRKLLILLLTYLVIGMYMWSIGIEKPHIQAIIPSLGFVLSTLTIPFAKRLWIHKKQAEI